MTDPPDGRIAHKLDDSVGQEPAAAKVAIDGLAYKLHIGSAILAEITQNQKLRVLVAHEQRTAPAAFPDVISEVPYSHRIR